LIHNLLSGLFILLSLALAYFDLRGWQKSKRIWFMISLVAAVLAAISFLLPTWVVGFLFIIPAALLFLLGTVYKRK
jgi:hypothetical protein